MGQKISVILVYIMKKYDLKYNEILFGLDYLSEYSDNETDMRLDLAKIILNDYDNQSAFDGWFDYVFAWYAKYDKCSM